MAKPIMLSHLEVQQHWVFLFTWDSRLRSSCIAELKQDSRDVLAAGGAGSATPDPWEGRGRQRRPQTAQRVQG